MKSREQWKEFSVRMIAKGMCIDEGQQ